MIELAIVGAGSMGRNHGRVAMGMRDARVAFVVDPSEEAGGALATATGAKYARDIDEVAGDIDAAVISVPTERHADLGLRLIDRGVHLLIEKPISRDLDEAVALISAADKAGVVLMVGHIERFNPAVEELVRIVENPIHIETHRISPYTPRIADGVVLDLMIHDLDIVRAIAKSSVVGIDAFCASVRSDTEDLAVASLRFANGVMATLTASRIGQQKVRRVGVTSADSQVAADLMTQALTIHRVGHLEDAGGGGGFRQSANVEMPFLPYSGEPLYRELAHFIECIVEGRQPAVSGRDGWAALALALDVLASANSGLTERAPLDLP